MPFSDTSATRATESVVHSIFIAVAMAGVMGLWQHIHTGHDVLWLVVGVLVMAWPLNLAERAMAVRSGLPPIAGMQQLTREVDAARLWRASAYASWLLSVVLAASFMLLAAVSATQLLQSALQLSEDVLSSDVMVPVVSVLLLALSLLRYVGHASVMAWVFVLLGLIALALFGAVQGVRLPLETTLMWPELAAVSPLLGGALLGAAGASVRWREQQDTPRVTGFLGFAVTLLAALALLAAWLSPFVAVCLMVVAALLACTAVLRPALAILQARGLALMPSLLVLFVLVQLLVELAWYGLSLSQLAPVLTGLTLLMLLNALIVAIFVGWKMKISHARKALGFRSEAIYNLWRVAVRWLAPSLVLYVLWQAILVLQP